MILGINSISHFNKVFESIAEASMITGISEEKILSCIEDGTECRRWYFDWLEK